MTEISACLGNFGTVGLPYYAFLLNFDLGLDFFDREILTGHAAEEAAAKILLNLQTQCLAFNQENRDMVAWY